MLDIGSGAGKFCLVGAACTAGKFIGVEQRANLVELSNALAVSFNVPNAEFLQANVTEISFTDYDSFYFFNSFYENVSPRKKIDESVTTGQEYFVKYSDFLTRELLKQPPGTRLVTYWNCLWEVPKTFEKQFSDFNGLLNFWEKVA